MSKMREAWKKFCDTETAGPTGNFEFDLFAAGYQAAIAAIKAGGVRHWQQTPSFEGDKTVAPLYNLPDDLT